VTVINPAAMPAGTELFLGYVNTGRVHALNARLIYANSYTCSTGVPPRGPAGS
jgi:queuine/archaeosine tRNA-ribosyltransferase